jgi:hypothetical protein
LDVVCLICLPLHHKIATCVEAAAPPMKAVEHIQFGFGQDEEVAQLSGKGAVNAEHRIPFDPMPKRRRVLISRDYRASLPATLPWISASYPQSAAVAMRFEQAARCSAAARNKSAPYNATRSRASARGTATSPWRGQRGSRQRTHSPGSRCATAGPATRNTPSTFTAARL